MVDLVCQFPVGAMMRAWGPVAVPGTADHSVRENKEGIVFPVPVCACAAYLHRGLTVMIASRTGVDDKIRVIDSTLYFTGKFNSVKFMLLRVLKTLRQHIRLYNHNRDLREAKVRTRRRLFNPALIISRYQLWFKRNYRTGKKAVSKRL
jgi:hypothetical protein